MHVDYQVITFLNIDSLHETNDELAETIKQKDILLSTIAHDVRSPLATIRHIIQDHKEMDFSADEIVNIFSHGAIKMAASNTSIANSLTVIRMISIAEIAGARRRDPNERFDAGEFPLGIGRERKA